MSGSRLISAFGLAVIFAQISANLSADIVPVVLLHGETPESTQSVDPLRIMPEREFLEKILNIVGGSGSPIAVFTKRNLCIEGISQAKLQLSNIHVTYLPFVASPLSVLENINSYNSSMEEKPETISDGQTIFYNVDDLAVIPEFFKILRDQNPYTLGVITGASCKYSRSERTRRAATGRADTEIIAQADRVLLYSSNGIYLKAAGEEEYSALGELKSVSSVSNTSDSVRFELTFNSTSDIILRLQFAATASKYWYFESVEYEFGSTVLTLMSNDTIYFPFNFSYHCTKNSVFYNNATYLNFTDIQVQIDPRVPTVNGTAVFSDGYDCIGFTSIPILSGLFVTAILALIMIWAMTMIMDIRTMDRFDDPKGKTITIAASE